MPFRSFPDAVKHINGLRLTSGNVGEIAMKIAYEFFPERLEKWKADAAWRTSLQHVVKHLDLHEFLDRVVERIVEPQRELVSFHEELLLNARNLWASYGLVRMDAAVKVA